MQSKTYLVLPPVMEAYRRPRDAGYAPLPRWRADCAPPTSAAKPFDLVVPQADLAVLIPTELGGKRSQLVLQACIATRRRCCSGISTRTIWPPRARRTNWRSTWRRASTG